MGQAGFATKKQKNLLGTTKDVLRIDCPAAAFFPLLAFGKSWVAMHVGGFEFHYARYSVIALHRHFAWLSGLKTYNYL